METKRQLCKPEIWGGIECTINRVGNTFRDQLYETVHYNHPSDIAHFAELGIAKMRYPVLWEKHQPDKHGHIDWGFTQKSLEHLRSENIVPVAGLLHHGSGPAQTSLLDENFPEKLAHYALQVASQFPWVEFYTPVNEPLTTARFSGLYGFWYPHAMDERSFLIMLLNQVKGIILSMQAIRTINPAAKLVQTEDLCKVHSTPRLSYQAEFENERRWLTCDLLCGRVKPGHALWNYFLSFNIAQDTMYFFVDNACPPDIMGFNYYVTSERYLDDRLENYPPHMHGGNGLHRYADTDAARTAYRCGLSCLLEEAWARCHLPMAITECHLNCSREEQMRWLKETWDVCCHLKQTGVPLIAVTAWALLGSFDWDTLLLQENRNYESGVFDISAGYLRATILANMIAAWARGENFKHPLLMDRGWWHEWSGRTAGADRPAPLLIITCGTGPSSCFERLCHDRHINFQKLSPGEWQKRYAAGHWHVHDHQRPWGLIFDVKDHEIDPCLIRYGENNRAESIPVMVYDHAASHEMRQWVAAAATPLLVVQVDPQTSDGMKLANHALDLFIDGEHGFWFIGCEGARKVNMTEEALFQ